MADRKTDIVDAMQKLVKKASRLAVEHSKTIEEYQRLKAELEAITPAKSAIRAACTWNLRVFSRPNKRSSQGSGQNPSRGCRDYPAPSLAASSCLIGAGLGKTDFIFESRKSSLSTFRCSRR
jgi:hypothetical protein